MSTNNNNKKNTTKSNKNSNKSKSNASKNTKKHQNKKNTEKNDAIINNINIGYETMNIIFIAISILMFFSINLSFDFILTRFIKSIFVGIFGFSSYIIPFILCTIGIMSFINKKPFDNKKYILCIILIVLLSSLADVLANKSFESLSNDRNFIVRSFVYASLTNGGIVGGIFGGILEKLIGTFISSIFLIASSIIVLIFIFDKSYEEFFVSIKKSFLISKMFIKERIDKSLVFDAKDDDEFYEQDIIFTKTENTTTNISSSIKIDGDLLPKINLEEKEEDILKTEPKEELEAIKNIDYSVNFGINRKRDKKLRESNNSKDGNGIFKNTQANMRKINPFAKKPKIRILDFSEHTSEYDQSSLRGLENVSNRNRSDDNYFVKVRQGGQQQSNVNDMPLQQTAQQTQSIYTEDTIKVFDEQQKQAENNLNALQVAQIEQYEKTIKSLKEEIDRQMFLFQDTQKEFLAQKNVEKDLLKIINAQRETIERQYNEIKAYENIHKSMSNSITNSPIVPTQMYSKVEENVEIIHNVELDVKQVEEAPVIEPINDIAIDKLSVNDEVSEDIINQALSQVKVESYKIAQEDILNDQQVEKQYNYEYDFDSIISTYNTPSVNFDSESDNNQINSDYKVEEYKFAGGNDSDYLGQDVSEYAYAKSEIKQNVSGYVYTNQQIGNNENNIEQLSSDINAQNVPEYSYTNNQSNQDVYEFKPQSDSIFKNEQSTPQYRQPIKPNFDEQKEEKYVYKYPDIDFLESKPVMSKEQNSKTELIANSKKLEATLKSFGVSAKVMEVSKGPSVTRYEIQPGTGVKVSKIANLSDDLALNLAAKSIRIQAPIPGKAAVGIEVPNDTKEMVYLREVLDDENFKNFKSKLAFGIGKDISGKIVVSDLATMPHLLIAGATGSGKSVCVNTLITSIVYKSSPEEVKLLMIDPKVVELSVYNGIPHLLIPVVTDPKKASAALNWAVREMEKRYKLFSDKTVRDLKGYNKAMEKEGGTLEPQIVIIIDELADLMMTASKEVESAIIRIAQMARAAGIHLIIATQRPTVDVITGLIKSNIPSRIAFAVSSGIDSKTILDEVGAEKLLGKGDMLFKPMGSPEPFRIQGAFISDKEVESIVSYLKTDTDHEQMKEIIEEITSTSNPKSASSVPGDTVDEIFEEVVEFIIEQQRVSVSLIQRTFRVGFNRASRIFDELESFGVIGSDEGGNKPRKVLMTMSEWDNKFKT